MNKKIITMILTVVSLCFVFPAFADVGAVAPISTVPVSYVAKAGEEPIMTATVMGSQSQTASCQTCHSPEKRPISHRQGKSYVKHNLTNKKPIVLAGAVFMHPD